MKIRQAIEAMGMKARWIKRDCLIFPYILSGDASDESLRNAFKVDGDAMEKYVPLADFDRVVSALELCREQRDAATGVRREIVVKAKQTYDAEILVELKGT